MSITNYLFFFIGMLCLTPPMTPLGIIILLSTYKCAQEDEEKKQRQRRQATQNVKYEVVECDEDGVEYEEVDVAYPDAEEEFENKEFRRNLKRWR